MTEETAEQRRQLNAAARAALRGEDDGARVAVPSLRTEAEQQFDELARFALGRGDDADRLITTTEGE